MATVKRLIDANAIKYTEYRSGGGRDYPEDIVTKEEIARMPTVNAVPVERLGSLGKLLIDYKGCPRGQVGRACGVSMEEELTAMDPIIDVDGGKWIPVYADALYDFIEKFKKLVEIPDCTKCAFNQGIAYWHQCEKCLGEAKNNFVSITEVNHE